MNLNWWFSQPHVQYMYTMKAIFKAAVNCQNTSANNQSAKQKGYVKIKC